MKRCSTSLVTYDSSDGSDGENVVEQQKLKKRKLPVLSSSIVVPTPKDNPALHQGRIRTAPHVDGQYASHVYVSLTISRRSALYPLLQQVIKDAKEIVPSIHEFHAAGDRANGSHVPELHISLSRLITLRAYQRDELKKAVKAISKQHTPFSISFAKFAELTNDEGTRTFLTMEVGAGHNELRSLCDALTPALQSIRQKEFYANPRFHASIGWALLDQDRGQNSSIAPATGNMCNSGASSHNMAPEPTPIDPGTDCFPTIPRLPEELIGTLNERHGENLASSKVGTFHAENITLKIGKEIFSFRLAGV